MRRFSFYLFKNFTREVSDRSPAPPPPPVTGGPFRRRGTRIGGASDLPALTGLNVKEIGPSNSRGSGEEASRRGRPLVSLILLTGSQAWIRLGHHRPCCKGRPSAPVPVSIQDSSSGSDLVSKQPVARSKPKISLATFWNFKIRPLVVVH